MYCACIYRVGSEDFVKRKEDELGETEDSEIEDSESIDSDEEIEVHTTYIVL